MNLPIDSCYKLKLLSLPKKSNINNLKFLYHKKHIIKKKLHTQNEFGAHFNYIDLVKKLNSLIIELPADRLGDNGTYFIENKREKETPILTTEKNVLTTDDSQPSIFKFTKSQNRRPIKLYEIFRQKRANITNQKLTTILLKKKQHSINNEDNTPENELSSSIQNTLLFNSSRRNYPDKKNGISMDKTVNEKNQIKRRNQLDILNNPYYKEPSTTLPMLNNSALNKRKKKYFTIHSNNLRKLPLKVNENSKIILPYSHFNN